MLERFKSRKLWIALIGQITGIIILVFGPEHADSIENVAQNLGGLMLMALTGAGYIQSQGKVDAAEVYFNGPDKTIITPIKRPENSQRASILTMLLIPAFLWGCASDPETRWYQQRSALTSANRVLVAYSPQLSDDQVVKYGELLQDARTALDAAKLLLPAGGTTFEDYLNVVEGVLILLVEKRLQDESNGNTGSITNGTGDPQTGVRSIPGRDGEWGHHPRRKIIDRDRGKDYRFACGRTATAGTRRSEHYTRQRLLA